MAHQRDKRRRNPLGGNQINPLKVSGPDGRIHFFTKNTMHIMVRPAFMIMAFLKYGHLLKKQKKNAHHINPKKGKSWKRNDYKSINLCNVSYKFISELLVNRLHMVLPRLISPINAFVPNRNINANF